MKHLSTLRENGLTLIELLVVIGIIVTLGTISLPAINAARVKANQVKCANNMRQIGVAMISYAFDREGWLPTSTHGAAMQNSWIFLLQNYVGGGFDEIRICPADPKGQARRAAGGTSYVLNEFICVDQTSPFGVVLESFRNLDSLKNPSRTMFVFTVADRVGVSGMNDHTHSRIWTGWNAVVSDIQADRHRMRTSNTNQLSGGANYLYGDGRVEYIKAVDLKKIVDSGINPARPPVN